MPSRRRKNCNTRTMESHRGSRRSKWLPYSAFNPFSVVLRGPGSSSVYGIEFFFRSSDRPDGHPIALLPDCYGDAGTLRFQSEPLDLSGLGLRQCIQELHRAWIFVRCDRCLDVVLQTLPASRRRTIPRSFLCLRFRGNGNFPRAPGISSSRMFMILPPARASSCCCRARL